MVTLMVFPPIELIDEQFLSGLVENKIAEMKTLDYKLGLPGMTEHEKKEFLRDITSFANSSGGHMIYGMSTIQGIPNQVDGIDDADADAAILRLENLARDCVEPRIPGIRMRPIPLSSSRHAIVVVIPRSWAAPHMVTLQGRRHTQFQARNLAGKYSLDVGELRSAFVASETRVERIRGFRAERVARVAARETPVNLAEGPAMVIHVVPVGAFDVAGGVDFSRTLPQTEPIPPVRGIGGRSRYCFDGYLMHGLAGETGTTHYILAFRSGAFEWVHSGRLFDLGGRRCLAHVSLEQEAIEGLDAILRTMLQLDVAAPGFIMLSMSSVRGCHITLPPGCGTDHGTSIPEDALLVPERFVETYDCRSAEVLRSALDVIWNAAGYHRDLNFDDNGNWSPPR